MGYRGGFVLLGLQDETTGTVLGVYLTLIGVQAIPEVNHFEYHCCSVCVLCWEEGRRLGMTPGDLHSSVIAGHQEQGVRSEELT